MLKEFKQLKDEYPDRILIASIMEEYNKAAWEELIDRVKETGVDAIEVNFSCPHVMPERKMGAAVGQGCRLLEEVCGWINAKATIPIWAKMTPNITEITQVQEANWELYKKQKAAEAILEKEKAVEAQKLAAEATLYARKQAAEGELYAKKKEAEGLVALVEAQGVYVKTLLRAVGGNYTALIDYFMINGGMFQEIAKINAGAIHG